MSELDTLIDAVKQGDLGRVTAIVDAAPSLASARMPDGESPVMAALYRGHHQVVEALFRSGAEADVFSAAATGRVDDLRRLLSDPAAVHSFSSPRKSPIPWVRSPARTPSPTLTVPSPIPKTQP